MSSKAFALVGLLLLVASPVSAKSPRVGAKKSKSAVSSQVTDAIMQAKSLLAQGNRKLALEQLQKTREAAKSKAEQRELAAKTILFAEQFLTSEAFQRYQEAKAQAELSRWDECLRELDAVSEKDQDNLMVLRLRGQCELSFKRYDPATQTFKRVLAIVPDDTEARFSLAQAALAQKNGTQALMILAEAEPRSSSEIEQLAILKAHAFELLEKPLQAADVLREDQERHLEHIEVIYELGMLYSRISGHDWQARKLLSLFITRCKRMKEAEIKARKFDVMLPEAQATLAVIDKRLGV